VELVTDGVNGAVVERATAASLGTAIAEVVRAATALRETTRRWFVENADELRLERSLELVVQSYAGSSR
jgi:hypothetical protein